LLDPVGSPDIEAGIVRYIQPIPTMEDIAMSFDNYSDYQNDSALRFIEIGYTNAAVALLFMIIGIPLNGLVIAVILKKKMFSRPCGILLLNLATADLLLCLLHMPIPVVAGIVSYRDDTGFHGVCQASAILVTLLLLVVIYTVALMSMDRAVYLKKPLMYDDIITPWRVLIAIAILWAFCIAISLLPLLGFGRVDYGTRIFTCTPIIKKPDEEPSTVDISYFILLVACILLGHLLQFSGCGCIIYITRKSLLKRLRRALRGRRSQRSNGRGTDEGSNGALRKYQKDQLQMVKVFAGIFSTSLLTIIPIGVYIISAFFLNIRLIVWLTIVAYLSVLSKSVLHPIVESYMTNEIRRTISKLLQNCMKKCFNT
jgi:hypothetical protein